MPVFEATCAKGLEYLLKDELTALGAENVHEKLSRVSFDAGWEILYRCLMWSRVASRFLYPIATFNAEDDNTLYRQASIIDWAQHLKPSSTFAVSAQSYRSQLSHTRFISQRIKDAIVDYFVEQGENRPSVDLEQPDIAFHCRIRRNQVTLAVDLAGQGLHRRGYRVAGGAAPIKENLAAALLYRAGWRAPQSVWQTKHQLSPHQCHLYDPMAGSGTFLIEAAMMAYDIAPGLHRDYLTLMGWQQFQTNLWEQVVEEARTRAEKGLAHSDVTISGSDINPKAVNIAHENLARAGLSDKVRLQIAGLDQLSQFELPAQGTLIVNPPYSERLGEQKQVKSLYGQLGEFLKHQCEGWHAAILCPQKEFGHQLGIRAVKRYQFNNGSIACQLLCLDIQQSAFVVPRNIEEVDVDYQRRLSPQGEALLNRFTRNQKRLQSFLKQSGVSCYRLYDADLPEFNAAVDVYTDLQGQTWISLQEYKPPATVDSNKALKRLKEMQNVLAGFFHIAPANVLVKQRVKAKGGGQYAAGESDDAVEIVVDEYGRKFLLRLNQRIDTGLFIDHRKLRRLIGTQSAGKRLLNLFCYTASASVHAACNGATTTSVDLSNRYLEWAKQNFGLNSLKPEAHRFERADCMAWLQGAKDNSEFFDLIFVDPPTFSNSKKTSEDFDVQKAHPQLLDACLDVLADDGIIYFSNNYRHFKLDWQPANNVTVKEITRQTTSSDFARRPLHRCWKIFKNE